MSNSGIYFITNTINNRCYIGSSHNLSKRKYEHFRTLSKGTHSNNHLQHAYDKYGKDAFTFEVIEEIPSQHLVKVENEYLKLVKRLPTWYYNTSLYAQVAMKGRKHSTASKQKMSLAKMGRMGVFKGKNHTEEAKAKMGKANIRYFEQHTFKHRDTGEVFVGTRCEFFHKYSLDRSHITELIRGVVKQHKGWQLVK